MVGSVGYGVINHWLIVERSPTNTVGQTMWVLGLLLGLEPHGGAQRPYMRPDEADCESFSTEISIGRFAVESALS